MLQATAPKSLIQTTMKDLFLHGHCSDMTVTCQGFTVKVHRSILCTQSGFFKGAMNGNFKEGISHTVYLPDERLDTVERVLSFLYFNDYSGDHHVMDLDQHLKTRKTKNSASSAKNDGCKVSITAFNHAKVYVTTDRLGIPPLKDFAAKCFSQWCKDNWKSMDFKWVLEHSIAIMPPHDVQFQSTIVNLISDNVVELVRDGRDGAVLEFLGSHGKIGSAVIARLVQGNRVTVRRLKVGL